MKALVLVAMLGAGCEGRALDINPPSTGTTDPETATSSARVPLGGQCSSETQCVDGGVSTLVGSTEYFVGCVPQRGGPAGLCWTIQKTPEGCSFVDDTSAANAGLVQESLNAICGRH
jgi:hypothetical protein